MPLTTYCNEQWALNFRILVWETRKAWDEKSWPQNAWGVRPPHPIVERSCHHLSLHQRRSCWRTNSSLSEKGRVLRPLKVKDCQYRERKTKWKNVRDPQLVHHQVQTKWGWALVLVKVQMINPHRVEYVEVDKTLTLFKSKILYMVWSSGAHWWWLVITREWAIWWVSMWSTTSGVMVEAYKFQWVIWI